jgi:hypothetical protein
MDYSNFSHITKLKKKWWTSLEDILYFVAINKSCRFLKHHYTNNIKLIPFVFLKLLNNFNT